jgi:tetratricopeptide (TPR) repeat protein
MNKFNNIVSDQIPVFLLSMICFFIAAVFGWMKLHYGFNFIDEGYHMTEAWRLTVGDHYFKDKFTGAISLSPLINSIFFRIHPSITLLGFREIQYFLTIGSLILLSVAVYRVEKQYWYLPLVFSVFAFTGLDPIGMISNLYYQTYPNLFVTIHLALLLLGIGQDSLVMRRTLLVLSGVFLWLISFDLLHLSPVLISPLLIFYLFHKNRPDDISFDSKDLTSVVVPVIFCWLLFVGYFNKAYIQNILASLELISSTRSHATAALMKINWEAMKHIILIFIYMVVCIYSFVRFRLSYFIVVLSALTLLVTFMINTSCFGLIAPYYNGWFDRPMWFSSFIISSYVIILAYYLHKIVTGGKLNKSDVLGLLLILPCLIISVFSSIFSGLGLLTVLHASIPVIIGISVLILAHDKMRVQPYSIKFLILFLMLAPFFISTSWSDWKFTFFDVSPGRESAMIDNGFGKGIKTNLVYKGLYEWIELNAEKHSGKNDFIVSYNLVPMVYMIAKRRPALDDSYVDISDYPYSYYQTTIGNMKQNKREPRLAFVFEGIPALRPIALNGDEYAWFGKTFSFPSNDPISEYVVENMMPAEEFKLSDELKVRCFIDKAFVLQEKLRQDPDNPELNSLLGDVYQKREDFANAAKYYKKAAGNNPKLIPALQNLAVRYSQEGNDRAALDILKEIVAIDPGRADTYYNIACIYARQKKTDDSVLLLGKAVEKGFNNWNLLRTDPDLDNIRDTKYYRDVLKMHQN